MPSDIRRLQSTAWDIWRHDYAAHVRSRIVARFDSDTSDMLLQFCTPVQNPLRRIARLLAVTYTTPVYRTSGYADIDRAVRQYAADIDTALAEAERVMHACGDAFVVAYPASGRVGYRVLPPHQVDVSLDASLEPVYYEIGDVRYYADGSISTRNAAGWGEPAPALAACPVAWLRQAPYGDDQWSVHVVRDLVDGTLEIAISEAINAVSDYLRSYNQVYLRATSTPAQARSLAESTRIGPDTIVQSEIDTVQLADPKNAHYETIRQRIADLAATRGISETAYYSRDALVVGPELRKIWRENSKYVAAPERALLRGTVAVLVRMGVLRAGAVAADWVVDYREPTPDEANPLTSLEILDRGVRLGVDSPVDWLLRTDREIVTREEAEARLRRNAEDRAMVVELMRRLNTPAETNTYEVPPSPEQNGARGPSAVPEGLAPPEGN